jgi:hypothetical protein
MGANWLLWALTGLCGDGWQEWPGDMETLFLDVTHRTFYIEISQVHSYLTERTIWMISPKSIHPQNRELILYDSLL